MRTPYQGVTNIVRFNWHFFAAAAGIALAALTIACFLPPVFSWLVRLGVIAGLISTLVSLVISWYVYDRSELYRLNWIDTWQIPDGGTIVTINAGFDEISETVKERLPESKLYIWDFYDEEKHTEIAIKRARMAYPLPEGTRNIDTSSLPAADEEVDLAIVFMAAHEIRNPEERVNFFRELRRILKAEGKVVVTEHLRDLPNLAAYTIGAFHFYSKATWNNAFKTAGFAVWYEQKENPFVSTFVASR